MNACTFVVVLSALLMCGCSMPTTATPSARITVVQALVPDGKFARRHPEKMVPRYITIHSTQNTDKGANALSHANGQKAGNYKGLNNRIGYVSWHFTVDDRTVYQSIPISEQAQHADYEGPGNKTSIGIEMCENVDGDWNRTLDNTAMLTAQLIRELRIPISNVVPHMHWHRTKYSDGTDLGFKKCPEPLLDGGKLGPKWQSFISRIRMYYASK